MMFGFEIRLCVPVRVSELGIIWEIIPQKPKITVQNFRYIFGISGKAKNLLMVKNPETFSIIFGIFCQIWAIFLLIEALFFDIFLRFGQFGPFYRPEYVKKCQKITINFWQILSIFKNVKNIPKFLTFSGWFWSFGKIFGKFCKSFGHSKTKKIFELFLDVKIPRNPKYLESW